MKGVLSHQGPFLHWLDSPKISRPILYLQAGAELDHLLGLDVLEAVDAGDTVTDAEDAARLLQVGLGRRTQDALLQDGRDFGRGGRRVCSGGQLLGQDAGRSAILGHLK